MKDIVSYSDLKENLKDGERNFVLLYKKGSKQSDCAYDVISKLKIDKSEILYVNVANIRDIHGKYAITSVPSLLEFDGSDFKNNYKGCQSSEYYTSLIEASLYKADIKDKDTSAQKSVTVYSTPTCSWCTTLKNHLNMYGIRYTDIDISKNESAAKAMMAKSGQQGVPQTDIGGEMIVGFDKNRINLLLGI
ncbi:MAG: NrdH-redoxin [Bacteroidetes bacterium 4572_112]|nr:MAG: NrdH-redoxin [Bacteroidetes bacterium 4572_112]